MKNLFIFLIVCANVSAFAARESGGQFQYYPLMKQINYEAATLANKIDQFPADEFDRIFSQHKVNKAELANILRNLDYVPVAEVPERTRKNPLGYEEPLILDHGTQNGVKKVTVLKSFLDLVISKQLNGPIDRNLFHEALHFYGYNQDEAWESSGHIEVFQHMDCYLKAHDLGGRCVIPEADSYRGVMKQIVDWLANGVAAKKQVVFMTVDLTPDWGFIKLDLDSKDRLIHIESKNNTDTFAFANGNGQIARCSGELTSCYVSGSKPQSRQEFRFQFAAGTIAKPLSPFISWSLYQMDKKSGGYQTIDQLMGWNEIIVIETP